MCMYVCNISLPAYNFCFILKFIKITFFQIIVHTRFICRQSHSQSRQLKIKLFALIDRIYEIKDDEYDSPHDTDSLDESDSPNHESSPNQFEEDDDHQQHDTFDRLVGVV